MNPTVMERTVADVLGKTLDAADDGSFVVAPDVETITGLVESLDGDGNSPRIRLLADTGTLKTAMDEFLIAGRAANLVDSERLDIRQYDGGANALVVTGSSVVAVVRGDGRVAGLTTDDGAFVEETNGRLSTVWAGAEPYKLRTPPLSRVRSTLESELGPSTAEAFDSVFAAVEATGGGLDEVTVSLLVAAKREELLYDLSKWGEDVGIASKATFSRTKTRLENEGLIETKKVPIDVGRPRLRLKLAEGRLETDDDGEFVRVARSMLES